MNLMNDIIINISNWSNTINNYNRIKKECLHNINLITELKDNFDKFLGNQRKDDLIFYASLINNSQFYLFNSIKIRQNKFIKDLNVLWYKMETNKYITDISNTNITILFKDYQCMADDIKYANENSTNLLWVKKDTVDSLTELENNMNEILYYHINIISQFSDFVKLEMEFYYGEFTSIINVIV